MKNTYYINNIHDNDVNNISVCYLLHDVLNSHKRIKWIVHITSLSYMDVLIYVEVRQSIQNFESY